MHRVQERGVGRTLHRHAGALVVVVLASCGVNLLYLTGAIYMLTVYDRVVPTGSVATLVALSVLALGLFGFHAALDIVRLRILTRIASAVSDALSADVFGRALASLGGDASPARGTQLVQDLDRVRGFLSSTGPTAFFDLPWLPVYLAICFAFHPLIGMTAAAGAIVLVALAIAMEWLGRRPFQAASLGHAQRDAIDQAGRQNAEAVLSMGIGASFANAFTKTNTQLVENQRRASDIFGGFGAASRSLRLGLQSAVLGVGAWLVIHNEATAGIMIAGSIIAARALAPVELAIAQWRSIAAARQSWRRLQSALGEDPQPIPLVRLPQPREVLEANNLAVAPPGNEAVVGGISFRLTAGQAMGIIGPIGSGKTSLVRTLVGVWPPARGEVRLDHASLDQYDRDQLGRCVGYVPQEIRLFAGTVAQNISRFDPDAEDAAVIAAARAAGIHEMILRLPKGYLTEIGEGGSRLSAGQRQLVALARALYRDPFLVVLDEPNAHLDGNAERLLTAAMMGVRERGGIVVLVAHRAGALAVVDHVMMLIEGQMSVFGPKDEVLVARPRVAAGDDAKEPPLLSGEARQAP